MESLWESLNNGAIAAWRFPLGMATFSLNGKRYSIKGRSMYQLGVMGKKRIQFSIH